MIVEAGFAIVIFWSWPGDGPKDTPESFTTARLYETASDCKDAISRDFQQFEIELQQDLGYPGRGRAVCRPVFDFNRQEVTK